ncbi:MAG TPA: HlyD family efflux transporter periplasmic adaptor subunit [Bacteroidia bacterium]|jgi:HlyD family secretion protein|nr:HlyD family efflux transporter periplasmic adaptor subunit [Bacteroidia bacterium]
MKVTSILTVASLAFLYSSCSNADKDYDASGAFESVETIISTESSGTLMQFDVEEGQTLNKNQWIGYVDSFQLYQKKQQLEAQIVSTTSQRPNIPVQVAALQSQLSEAETNQKRMENLVKANAATRQQMDDANTQVDMIKKQIDAQKSTLGIASTTLTKDVAPLQHQIDQINDQLQKCKIINPLHGTVLTKYSENHEIVSPGKALYKIAETDTLILRAYITGSQLTNVKLGQTVKVRTDLGTKQYRPYTGVVYWISDKSEFTPKTIPTKDERADLVYAIKVRVINDGYLKIGMYGEVKFDNTQTK